MRSHASIWYIMKYATNKSHTLSILLFGYSSSSIIIIIKHNFNHPVFVKCRRIKLRTGNIRMIDVLAMVYGKKRAFKRQKPLKIYIFYTQTSIEHHSHQ